MRNVSLLSLLVATLAACSPFDPEVPEGAFRCGPDDTCPSGFACESGICEADGGGGGGPDAGNTGSCNNDSVIEPNNQLSQATFTPVADQMPTATLATLAICPETDQDYFEIRVVIANTNLTVNVAYEDTAAPLALVLLNNQGSQLASGGAVAGMPGNVRVTVNNLAVGSYFVRVSSSNGENNYDISFTSSQ